MKHREVLRALVNNYEGYPNAIIIVLQKGIFTSVIHEAFIDEKEEVSIIIDANYLGGETGHNGFSDMKPIFYYIM